MAYHAELAAIRSGRPGSRCSPGTGTGACTRPRKPSVGTNGPPRRRHDAASADRNASLRAEIVHSRGEALDATRQVRGGARRLRARVRDRPSEAVVRGSMPRSSPRSPTSCGGSSGTTRRSRSSRGALEAARQAGLPVPRSAREVSGGWGGVGSRGSRPRARRSRRGSPHLAGGSRPRGRGVRANRPDGDRSVPGTLRSGDRRRRPGPSAVADLGHRPTANAVAQMLGYLRLLTGDVSGARALFEESLAGARELGMGREEPLPLLGLALVAMARGELGRAMSHLDGSVDAAEVARSRQGCDRGPARPCAAPPGARSSRRKRWPTSTRWRRLGAAPAHYLGPVRLSARACHAARRWRSMSARATFDRARSHV